MANVYCPNMSGIVEKRMLLVDPRWDSWMIHFQDTAERFNIPLIVDTAATDDQADTAMMRNCYDIVFSNDRKICERAKTHGAESVFFSGTPESVSAAKDAGFMGIDKGRFSIEEVAKIILESRNDRCHEEEGV